MFEKLKEEYFNNVSNDPAYYFNTHWIKLLNYYIEMAYTVGYEEGLKNLGSANKKPVILKKGNTYIEFSSRTEAAKYLEVEKRTLSKSLRRNHKCKGYEVTEATKPL